MELYYYEGSTRLGPVNPAQLKALAARGIVTPDTVVESGAKKLLASKVKGLEFPPAAPSVPPPVPPVFPAAEPAAAPAEPAAASEKPKHRTMFTPFGVSVEVEESLPEMPPAGSSSAADSARRESIASLDKACDQVTQIGWLFALLAGLGAAGALFAFVQGIGAGIVSGIASAISCGIACQLFFFLGKVGRFLIDWRQRGE